MASCRPHTLLVWSSSPAHKGSGGISYNPVVRYWQLYCSLLSQLLSSGEEREIDSVHALLLIMTPDFSTARVKGQNVTRPCWRQTHSQTTTNLYMPPFMRQLLDRLVLKNRIMNSYGLNIAGLTFSATFFFKFNYFLFVSLFISFSCTFVRIYFQAWPLLPITHITMYTHSDSHPFHRLDTFLWYILSSILSPYTFS